MKSRLGLLLCGVVLMAAAPVWADKAPNDESLKDFGNPECLVSAAGSSNLGLNAGATSAMDIHSDSLSGVDSDGLGSSLHTNWIKASKDGHFEDGLSNPAAMPEPASFPLILLGLVSVGILVRRREKLSTTI
jgi:hypothetical protein